MERCRFNDVMVRKCAEMEFGRCEECCEEEFDDS